MVATVIGLIYIIRTFRSQIDVQRSQVAMLEIEIDRFVDEKKPVFKLMKFEYSGEQIDADKPNVVLMLQKTGQLDALELNISAHDCRIENVGQQVNFREHDILTLLYFQKEDSKKSRSFHSFITFKDRYGNHYRQVVNSWISVESGRFYSISEPRMNESINS